ncbi:hypothetical protein R3W88_016583 [Solanum pinnatisectum]|uniref:Retrotransposon gag domain-containing protein n=1 Tax=Solanum pinnatisectum TaxID=50273 RepID=A0AAV9L049_9SOLN|nr:hypothetical protein R3W88_016583 [Solanum pinnatisectum]
MPSQRAIRGLTVRGNVEDQGVPNAPEVKPQGEVTNAEFWEAIRMLSQKSRAEGAPIVSWAVFESAFMRRFFPRELREAKVREFLTLKYESMSVHEYSLKFTQLFRYAPKMVADMRTRMGLFVAGLCSLSSKEGKTVMLIGDMDIARLMIHVQQVEEDKLMGREEF